MKYSLLSIGEAMAELRQTKSGGFDVGFAGDTYNASVYFARALLNDARSANCDPVGYVTCVGYDPLSEEFLSLLKSEQICTRQISRIPNTIWVSILYQQIPPASAAFTIGETVPPPVNCFL